MGSGLGTDHGPSGVTVHPHRLDPRCSCFQSLYDVQPSKVKLSCLLFGGGSFGDGGELFQVISVLGPYMGIGVVVGAVPKMVVLTSVLSFPSLSSGSS